ncbi:MAG: glutathione S-transferase family protein [Caulobacteraceae bacterium]|nr:MAG: glutathione S-transferase family protein [Caulobacteraceae bacterium]
MKLVIGTKNWSTWSLRPWLVLKRSGVAFDEVLVELRRDDTPDQIRPWSPSGKIPCLIDGELAVWDSLAICEYLAERDPYLWPADTAARAQARSACAEMHSGFMALRNECPMDLTARAERDLSEAAHKDIRRIVSLWLELRTRYGAGGPYLFGAWSIADAFFTPVATRFRTYDVLLSNFGDTGEAARYVATLLDQPEFLEWEKAALAD